MKRVIALLLAMILFTGILPIDAAATEQEFVNVQLILDGKPRQYKVIESGSELMFSGEDLAAMGGYEYRIEQGSAYFTRGMKTLRVDLEASRLYPFEDIALISKINMAEKVREVHSVYYFPGTEMLPWLNVDCFVLEGQLNICKDEVSIWEIIPVFAPEEFGFDFTACCKELGVNGKYLKARAYLQDEGLTGMFFDIIPVVGDSLDYYDLFEDIVQDQSAADEEIDEMLEDAEDVSYWMEIAEDFEVIEDLPDELRLFGEVANFLSNNAVSFSFEMASYVKYFYQNHENILAAFHSMIVNSGVYKHQLPMTAISALMEVEESYTDYYAGIEYKMMKTIGETAFEGLASVPSGLFDAATTLVGFAEATSPDWAEGINRIASYDMIAEYCVKTYGELTDHTWMSSIKDMCGLAYMYLYSCEQNWNAMADYAIKEGKLDLAAKYKSVAESTEEWQRKFMEAVSAAMNDSHEYEVVDGSMKQGYTDKLTDMFADVEKQLYIIGQYAIEDLVTITTSVCTCDWSYWYSESPIFEIPQINLDSEEINEINTIIWNDYSPWIHDCDSNDYPPCWLECEYAVNGDIMSLILEYQDGNYDGSSFDIYNISLSKKAPVNDETLIAAAGMTVSEYRTHVKQALGSICWDFCSYLTDSYRDYSLDEWFMCDELLQDTISDKNVDAARPYIGENGDLWVVGNVCIPAGGGVMNFTVNLNDYEIPPNYAESLDFDKPEEQMRIEISWDGKNSNGDLLWVDADFSGVMDDGSWVQIHDGLTYNEQDMPVAYCDDDWFEGSIVYHLYQLDGTFDFEVSVCEDVADFLGVIRESGARAVVTYPDGRSYTFTLDEGVYQSYTGHWFWAPFSIDHGALVEYDASWIQDASNS